MKRVISIFGIVTILAAMFAGCSKTEAAVETDGFVQKIIVEEIIVEEIIPEKIIIETIN